MRLNVCLRGRTCHKGVGLCPLPLTVSDILRLFSEDVCGWRLYIVPSGVGSRA